MPTAVDHVRLAAHNIEFACHLNSHPGYHDWSATVAFYASVHVVDALLAVQKPPEHPLDHANRATILKSSNQYKEIKKHHRALSKASLTARYMQSETRFAKYMSPADVRDRLLKHRLHSVIVSALKLGDFEQPELETLQTADEKLKSLSEPDPSGEPASAK